MNNKTCIICFVEGRNLVRPCFCNDSYYHKKCLKKWIGIKKCQEDRCEICKSIYTGIEIKNF